MAKASQKARGGRAGARLRTDIDRVLDIDFVEWDQVSGYVGRLEQILEDIKKLGKDQPAEALHLVWYFVEKIPMIFNSIHDECELEEFCMGLLEAALELGRKAGASMEEVGTRLVDAYLSDADDTCRFDGALDLLREARLAHEARAAIAGYAERKAEERVPRPDAGLLEFAKKIRSSAGRRGQLG